MLHLLCRNLLELDSSQTYCQLLRSGSSSENSRKNSSLVIRKAITASSENSKESPLTLGTNSKSSVSLQRKPSRVASLPEKRIVRVSEMQTHMGQIQEELKTTKDQLSAAEEERDRVLEKLKEMKMVAEELNNVKNSEGHALDSLSESKKRVQELEAALKKKKESESKMFDSFASQTEQLQQTKVSLEESKIEIASLREKVEKLEGLSGKVRTPEDEDKSSMKEALESLQSEHHLTKENEKLASSKAQNLLNEMDLLKNELKLATEAEEKSKKAMDDLALALKEVATESNQVKEKLSSTEAALEQTKEELEQLKLMINSTEDTYKSLMNEAKKESDRFKNTAERLRLEAEESLLAWNEKEMGFVSCIKRVEEDRTATQQENKRLLESLLMAEKMTKVAKEENHKLRDILKQAINEANVAKEAAGIAKAENSRLKDCIAERDSALDLLTQEIENLRSNAAQFQVTIKGLKQMLSTEPKKELKSDDKEQEDKLKMENSVVKEHKDSKKLGKAFSFDLKEFARHSSKHKDVEEDTEMPEALKGSIFDIVESPRLAAPHHRKKSSSVFTDDGETVNSDDYDHLDGSHLDDSGSSRKKRALLRRFSDLLRRRSFYRKEQAIE